MKRWFPMMLALVLMLAVGAALADAKYDPVDPADPYGSPVHGLFHNQEIRADGIEGRYSIQVPEGMQPWNPSLIILIPDGLTAQAFTETETGLKWLEVSAEHGIAVTFIEPQNGAYWNLSCDSASRHDAELIRQVYIRMRSKSVSVDHAYTMDKANVGLVGYGEGAAAALLTAAEMPTMYSGVVAVDAAQIDAAQLEKLGKQYCYPWPADNWNGVDDVKLAANQVELPMWFVSTTDGAPDNSQSIAYFAGVNGVQTTGENALADQVMTCEDSITRIWVSDTTKGADITQAQIWLDFLSQIKRFLGFAGGRLAYTTDFAGEGFTVTQEMVDGFQRRFITYVPSSYTGEAPVPMVMVMHGSSASMYAIAEESRWFDVAEEYGFIVNFCQAYMNGRTASGNIPAAYWNEYASPVDEGGSDDVAYLRHVIEKTKADYAIDERRIYATGHSNGANMTWRLASDAGELLAAIAPVGHMKGSLKEDVAIDVVMPVYTIKGEYDVDGGYVLSQECNNVKGIRLWNARNGVNETLTQIEREGLYERYTFVNDHDVPLMTFVKIDDTPHAYFPDEAEEIWTRCFSHYSRGEDGTLYFDGQAIERDTYTSNDCWIDEKVEQMAREEIESSRLCAFYPAAYESEGFQQFYVDFHLLAKKLRSPGVTADDYSDVIALKEKREALVQIAEDPKTTVWEIWGEQMACEDMEGVQGWELAYDSEGFRPFLNPYLLEDQETAKGNVIIIAGGSNTHRTNQVEGYPVAEYFNANGYNAYVLQRRILPYQDVDSALDLARSIRYIRYHAQELGIGATDKVATCGFSAGGANILAALGMQYGHVMPDSVYSNYVPDDVDRVNADYGAALLIYGANVVDLSRNPNLPDFFIVAGQRDTKYWTRSLAMAGEMMDVVDVEVYLAPDAPHGFGLATGVDNYIDGFEAASSWPELAVQFLDIQFGHTSAIIDMTK